MLLQATRGRATAEAAPPPPPSAFGGTGRQRSSLHNNNINNNNASLFCAPLPPRGGILADEVGLGKTLDVIALVLRRAAGPADGVESEGRVAQYAAAAAAAREEEEANAAVPGDARRRKRGAAAVVAQKAVGGGVCIPAHISVGSTLIVVPGAILPQWLAELRAHAPSLPVLAYTGMKMKMKMKGAGGGGGAMSDYDYDGGGGGRYLEPFDLTCAAIHRACGDGDGDSAGGGGGGGSGGGGGGGSSGGGGCPAAAAVAVVLTSYEALRADLRQSQGGLGNADTRRRSPLLRVLWWRAVLDEAQTVCSGASLVAKACVALRRRHSWCVSGTPLGRGRLADLFGLLAFVGAAPFDAREVFRACLLRPLQVHESRTY